MIPTAETGPQSPEARRCAPDDRAAVVASVARAFDDDPVWGFALRQEPAKRESAYRATVEAALDVFGKYGLTFCTNGAEGASIWAPPGSWQISLFDEVRLLPVYLRSCGLARLRRGMRGMDSMKRVHPTEPHYYLYLIGVDPSHQGKGLGSALMKDMLERCDRERTPAYLESTKETNLAFYRRHGFEVRDTIAFAGDGPPIWTMWRSPQP